MIDKSNIKTILPILGFKKERNGNWKKHYSHIECDIKVNFSSQKFEYPESDGMIINDKTTSNFLKPENFIVFECINRLFDKGYRPEHIELERKWTLGHDPKSGKADICVFDRSKKSVLMIIECKRDSKEYLKERKNTLTDGGQLFSYWQQEGSTKWLSLYYSDYIDGKVVYRNETIKCSDDKNIELLAKKDSSIVLYKNANTAPELFAVWDETYSKQFLGDIIFDEDSIAYKIGEKPLRKKKLKKFDSDDKDVNNIVLHFEEILRHNNISDKENAFNRLVALFICKLVDEIGKSENDIVDFQYRVGTDTYESLQDRLQRLHRDGMEKFMKEKISYISDDYPEKLFAQKVNGPEREQAIADLRNTIRILKFYSNNDFSFKDVHNEELFYQNGKALVEVVQLFEPYRIVYPSRSQFLGDLFERLLNNGFKQDEGQFFTPTPITRFIWDSLPLDKITQKDTAFEVPKIIDYACGAGHFLTEGVEAIDDYFNRANHHDLVVENRWTQSKLFGVEKDYRLARVSKISLYMNGAGDGNIIFGDGLDQYIEKGIENNTFDILVANPPYTVRGFKPHLKLKNNSLSLLQYISNEGDEIETLFIERIEQLLKSEGIAAVILPEPIFSNETESERHSRIILLQNFKIRAFVRLGSHTFSETGTNTDIVFLEKFDNPPKRSKLICDSVKAILTGQDISGWEDEDILDEYLSTISVDNNNYKDFIQENLDVTRLSEIDYFAQEIKVIESSPDFIKRISSSVYKKLSADQQQKEYKRIVYDYLKRIESEKLYFFALVYQQNTLIITAPESTNDEQQFLGYKWRKSEIKVFNLGGKMFSASHRDANNTLAEIIRLSFSDTTKIIPDLQPYYRYTPLKNMLDFTRPVLNEVIQLEEPNKKTLVSDYPVNTLGFYCKPEIGGTPDRNNNSFFGGNNLWLSISEMNGQVIYDTKEKLTDEGVSASNVKLIPKGTLLLSFKLSIGKTAIAGKDLYTNEAIAGLIPTGNAEVVTEYLYYMFRARLIDLSGTGKKAFGKSLNSTYLRDNVYIPMPPKKIQLSLIKKCKLVDNEYHSTRMTEETYCSKIAAIFKKMKILKYI